MHVHVRTARRHLAVRARDMESESKVGLGGLGGVVTWRVDFGCWCHVQAEDRQQRGIT